MQKWWKAFLDWAIERVRLHRSGSSNDLLKVCSVRAAVSAGLVARPNVAAVERQDALRRRGHTIQRMQAIIWGHPALLCSLRDDDCVVVSP